MSAIQESVPGRDGTEPRAEEQTESSKQSSQTIPDFNIDVHGFLLMADEIKKREQRNEEIHRKLMERREKAMHERIAETHAELEAYRLKGKAKVAKKEHRQLIADQLAAANLELARLEIEIAKARLVAIRKGGKR